MKTLYMPCSHTFDCFESWTIFGRPRQNLERCYFHRCSMLSRPILSWAVNCLSIVLCTTRKAMKLCCVRDLLRSPAHFTLYSPVVCYEIRVKLAHTSARWIETTTYRVIFDELLPRKSLIHACMLKSCQDVLQRHYILQSMTLRTC